MSRQAFGAFLVLALANMANAHFVFVVPQPGGSARVFISEDLKPTVDVDADLVANAKLSVRDDKGAEKQLTLVKHDHYYEAAIGGVGPRLVHGVAELGPMQQGEGKPYLLVYYPKTILGDPFRSTALVGGKTPVEIVPMGNSGALRLKVLGDGQPLAKNEITVILPDGSQKKMTTDASGLTDTLTQTGRYGAWARYWQQTSGNRDGKSWSEVRNYATLVFDVTDGPQSSNGPPNAPAAARTAPAAKQFPALPEATASFGAVVSDGWLYVYGGHIAPTHSYSTAAVSGRFSRLKLADGGNGKWEQLPGGRGLQGMNLAAYKGKIYLIGGMSPRNKPGEPDATWSVADCARFDPATMKWESLPSLPQPRSSHDVVVAGDKLIVSGGWTLRGDQPAEWRDTLEILDLGASKLEWKSVKQPFRRRALIAASLNGRVYVIGGFDDQEQIIRDVSIYDPATRAWIDGPKLPGGGNDGFAPAACAHHGTLYASVADGGLYRLNDAKHEWEQAGHATPRVAQRIVSNGDAVLVIGGAANGRNSALIEAVSAGN